MWKMGKFLSLSMFSTELLIFFLPKSLNVINSMDDEKMRFKAIEEFS